MITLKQLYWSNAFSYGENNVVDFSNHKITQLVGKNGHGKTSIALILEEVLFNKNSKGIKKANILNRFTNKTSWSAELNFSKDCVDYVVKTQRGATQWVKLYKNGQDISAHTSTQTYKALEDILGIDHKQFCQLVYQNSANSLEFLTAPDTARKKFLIDILDLGKYTKAGEIFKQAHQELGKEVATVQGKVNTIHAWLAKYKDFEFSHLALTPIPAVDSSLNLQLAETLAKIKNIDQINKQINQNNTYKQLLENIELISAEPPTADIAQLRNQQTVHKKVVDDCAAFIQKLNKLSGTCPTCYSLIDAEKVEELRLEKQLEGSASQQELSMLVSSINQYNTQKQLYDKSVHNQQEWEKYHRLIDTTLNGDLLDKTELQQQCNELQQQIEQVQQQIREAEQKNQRANQHNSKVDTVQQQLEEMQQELSTHSELLGVLVERLSVIEVLSKTFSTTGLVAYKIECLVKDLEQIANEYLVHLSDGRFQLQFRVNTSDKLNVMINDNGKDVEINELSGGELARVNVATLLAIRKLMQGISSNRVNLLILDETVDALDVDGKEKLVEVLIGEEHLNTFLVSHGFTHPLLEKLLVVKENNISRLEV